MPQQTSISERDFESRVERFENAWQQGDPPPMSEFVRDVSGPDPHAARRELLLELVMIDLEYRWRRAQRLDTDGLPAGETVPEHPDDGELPPRPRLEDYLACFPELQPAESLPAELIAEEYRVRRRWGDRPGRDEYTSRYSGCSDELPPLLEKIDAQLQHEVSAQSPSDSARHAEQTGVPAPMPEGRQIGRFQLRSVLGQGAFGTVYLAYDPQLDRQVALKIPRAEALGGSQEIQRFLREARAAAQLRHPAIVPVYEAGTIDDTYFIACGFVAGRTLRDELKKGRRFTHLEAARLIARLAEALDYAHNQGIVHRDVKPENVMLDAHDRPHIMDFGSARRTEGDALETQEGVRMGTPAYMSPEQASGMSHLADGRADIWSLGVMLYELLVGRRPFDGSGHEVLWAVRDTEPAALRTIDKRIPAALETICGVCMAKMPERRYPSCRHLAEELERWSVGSPIHGRAADGTVKSAGRRARLAAAVLAIGSLLVGGAVIGRFLFPPADSPDPGPLVAPPGANPGNAEAIALPPPLDEPMFSWSKVAHSPDLSPQIKRVARDVIEILQQERLDSVYVAPFSGAADAPTDDLLAARLVYAMLDEPQQITVNRGAAARVSVDYGLSDYSGQTGVAVVRLRVRILNRRLEPVGSGDDLRFEIRLTLPDQAPAGDDL